VPVALLAVAGTVTLAGCGAARQDADEPDATFAVSVPHASFPARQSLGGNDELRLVIRNVGHATIPDLAVTVDGLSARDTEPGLASAQRPVWIVNNGPGPVSPLPVQGTGEYSEGGDVTAYTNTWASGPLRSGASATFSWVVTPVKVGSYSVDWTVAAGLNGKAKARLAGGQLPTGRFAVDVASAPAQTHVDSNTGQVVSGPAQPGPNG